MIQLLSMEERLPRRTVADVRPAGYGPLQANTYELDKVSDLFLLLS